MSAPTLALAGRTRVGWVGAGVMGGHMCAHLLAKGFKATVFSRTIAKAESLRILGATLADSVAEVCLRTSLISSGALLCLPHSRQVARNSDVVFTMLGLPSEVEDVVLGRTGLLRNLAPGSIVVDMSTSRPELACRIAGATLAHCHTATLHARYAIRGD